MGVISVRIDIGPALPVVPKTDGVVRRRREVAPTHKRVPTGPWPNVYVVARSVIVQVEVIVAGDGQDGSRRSAKVFN